MGDAVRSEAEYPATSDDILRPILDRIRDAHPAAELAVIAKAYSIAEEVHRGQRRKSGDAYITHPVAVATILAELSVTPATLAAGLLHDTVQDTSYSLLQLRCDFGDEIAALVDGFTKLDLLTYGEEEQAETVRLMMIAMARDVRVLVIKLADRLDNARTWCFVREETARRKAHETLEIYAPLAHRLGLEMIMRELEDRCLAVLYPAVNEEIAHLLAVTLDQRATMEAPGGVPDAASADERLALTSLTTRELDVLALAGAGLTNYQIGRRLGVSERTARKHMSAVYEKTGLTGRAAAAAWWQRCRRELTAGHD